MYSAHDATLTIMLAAMNMWSADCIYEYWKQNRSDPDDCITTFPMFATVMVFELYRYDSYSRDNSAIHYSKRGPQRAEHLYTFKINYNGAHKQIPFCGYKYECEVEALEEWVEGWAVGDFA
jgi:hypothetical protein